MKVVIVQLSEESHDYLAKIVQTYSQSGIDPNEAGDLHALWTAVNQAQMVDTEELKRQRQEHAMRPSEPDDAAPPASEPEAEGKEK